MKIEFTDPGRHFTSDNNSGVIPEVLQAIQEVNLGHMQAYGGDEITKRLAKLAMRSHRYTNLQPNLIV